MSVKAFVQIPPMREKFKRALTKAAKLVGRSTISGFKPLAIEAQICKLL